MALLHNLCYSIVDLHLLLKFYESFSSVLQYFNFVMSIVICLVGLVGNAVVICFIGFIVKKHKTKYWFLNLAIADFFALLTVPLHATSSLTGNWPFGPHMCQFFLFSLWASTYTSIFILIALNIARVLSVAQPMFHIKFMSQRVSFWICLLIWITAPLSSLSVFFYGGELEIGEDKLCIFLGSKTFGTITIDSGYNVSQENTTRDILVYTKLHPFFEQCSSDTCCGGEETLDFWNQLMFTSEQFVIPFIVIGYFIPLGILIICNISIVFHVRKSTTINTHRLYRIVLMIIVVYFITWTPIVLAQTMLFIAVHNRNLIVMINVITFSPLFLNISYLSSCLNPIVYVLSSEQMRTRLSDFISSIRNYYK